MLLQACTVYPHGPCHGRQLVVIAVFRTAWACGAPPKRIAPVLSSDRTCICHLI